MHIPDELKYTEEHEWVRVNGDIVTIGITDYAQGELGDIVFVELPEIGSQTAQLESCGTIEAVKAVSDLFAPVSGEVVEVNSELESNPQAVNKDPYGDGWMLNVQISDAGQLDNLLSAEEYQKLIDGL